MPHADLASAEPLVAEFRRALEDCQRVYRTAGQTLALYHTDHIAEPPTEFMARMHDLHRGLLIKVFLEMAQADAAWSDGERLLAGELVEHLATEDESSASLMDLLDRRSDEIRNLPWQTLVEPFEKCPPLAAHRGELNTVVMRIANLVSKIDGHIKPETTAQLKMIQYQLWQHLSPSRDEQPPEAAPAAVPRDAASVAEVSTPSPAPSDVPTANHPSPPPDDTVEAALAELDQLIGIDVVKREVHELVDYLKFQNERRRAQLPTTDVSLHMVFRGNPGTGKTTVARLVGRIFAALGVLKRGHLVETDRSGLVAEYAGQTGPKTNACIDEALDGVLFIDEAYSLASESREDAYGAEAVQTLLKRIEDDRHRLVVILAGYGQPMDRLLKSNPGLTSRFPRQLDFANFSAVELCQIIEHLCEQNHYSLPPAARGHILQGVTSATRAADEHFGNGRYARNLFEDAVRRMASRIASIVPLSREVLTTFAADDFDFPAPTLDESQTPALCLAECPACGFNSTIPAATLGQRIACRQCGEKFLAAWAPLAPSTD